MGEAPGSNPGESIAVLPYQASNSRIRAFEGVLKAIRESMLSALVRGSCDYVWFTPVDTRTPSY